MLNGTNTIFYVVSLDKDEERREHVISQLEKQNIKDYQIISAVYGKSLSDEELNKKVYKNHKNKFKWNIKLSKSEIGCALSHLKIYRDFLSSNYKFAVIFEDDMIFNYSFDNEIKNLVYSSFSEKKQVVLLGELKQFFKKAIFKSQNYKIVKTETAFFTHSYVINKEAAQEILNFNYPVKTTADNWLLFHLYLGIRVFGLDPFITDQNTQFESEINHIENTRQIKEIEKKIPFYQKHILWKRKFYKFRVKTLKIFFPFLFGSHFKRDR